MPLVAAFAACGLMIFSGYIYDQVHTDVTYLVTNLYLMTSLLLCGMVRGIKREPRKSKDEPTGSSKVYESAESQSADDESSASR